MAKRLPVFFLLPLFLSFIFTNVAFAENDPGTPGDFQAEITEQGNKETVELSWTKNTDYDEPDYFYVYKAEGNTSDLEDFDLYVKVKSNKNKDDFSTTVKNLSDGEYSFYVTAAIEDNGDVYESDPTEILSVEIGSANAYTVEIVSSPDKKAEAGEEWEYEIETETNAPEDCEVLFELLEAPEGMEIEENTITWTPAEKGNYNVELKAYLECDEDVYETQSFKINVSGSSTKLTLRIKSKAENKAATGELYTYQVEVETNAAEDCPVLYELSESPDGMSIDMNTGSLTWTPEEEGTFDVEVRAWLECDEDIDDTQKFKIKVSHESDYFVKITSSPDKSLSVGEDFTYDLAATSNAPEDCPVMWELIDAPDGMEIVSSSSTFSGTSYSMTWTPEEEGTYKFDLKAYLDCDNNVYDIQKINLSVKKGDKLYVRITSKPDSHGEVDEMYIYQLFAETNAADDCEILYELSDDAPDSWGLVENSSFTWTDEPGYSMTFTPEEPGVYKGWVYAWLDCDESVIDKQRIVINVQKKTADVPCAYIRGNVTDDDGANIDEGKVMVWRVDDNSQNDELKQVYKTEITDGTFEVNVSEGTYVVRVNAMESLNEWYNDANSIESAERIDIVCEDDITLDFVLTPQPEEASGDGDGSSATFSGYVVSADDAEPLHATVEFIPVDWMYKPGSAKPIVNKYTTETDEDGNYMITIPGDHEYIALAVADVNSGYMSQYFDGVYDPMEATILDASSSTMTSSTFSSSTFTVDFALEQSTDYYNGFEGTVVDEDGEPVESKVIAYLVEPDEDLELQYNYTQYVQTDEEGNYLLSNLVPGGYVVFSVPMDRTYVPGFYKEEDFVTRKWSDGTVITVSDEFLADQFELKHKMRNGMKGIAHMKGHLKRNLLGQIEKGGDVPQEDAENVSGAFVFVTDADGEVVDFTFTNNDGDFDMEELIQGEFTLTADKVGFEPFEEEIGVDYSEVLLIDVSGSLEDFTKVAELPELQGNILAYPSPTSGLVRIESDYDFTNVEVYNISGYKLYSDNNSPGRNNIMLDLNDYPDGLYLVKIYTDTGFKVLQVRKIK